MEADFADVNGGNAEVARDDTNLKIPEAMEPEVTETSSTIESQDDQTTITTTETKTLISPTTTTPIVDDTTETEIIKMDVEETNGDIKDDTIKKVDSPIKRKLRKSKSNSTSSVETDAKPKTRGQKRKSPDIIDNNNPPINTSIVESSTIEEDFFGFDTTKVDDDRGFKIIQKLIAETEKEETTSTPPPPPQPSAKRGRLLPRNTRQKNENNEITDNDVKSKTPIDSNKIKNDDIVMNNVINDKTTNSLKIDMTNPIYKEPFNYGWRREIIYKGLPDGNQKRSADIYYHSPSGKKVKNIKELAECLTTKQLTVDNFTFNKEPIGVDNPAWEVIRDAKRLRSDSMGGTTPSRKVVSKRGSIGKKLPSPIQPAAKTPSSKLSSPKTSGSAGYKVKVPVKRSSLRKEQKTPKESDMLPPQWSATTPTNRRVQAPSEKSLSPKNKKVSIKKKVVPLEVNQSQYFMVSVCAGYNALSRIFQYLKVQELLRASRVCKMWRDIAAQQELWKTVRMKNSQVTDWDGLVACLKRHGTQHLDLRKMIISTEPDDCWKKFIEVIPSVTSLTKLELCRCPVEVVQEIMKSCPHLEVLSAISIKCQSLSFESVDNMKNCKELRLKAINGISLKSDLMPLEKLNQLTLLSLTSIKDLGKQNINAISSLVNLVTLELGECSNFPAEFGTDILLKLTKLEKLRLEKGQGSCCTFDILDGISKLDKIHQVELINFDIKQGFDDHLELCKNIKKLMIIPTYISKSATSNNMILGGVTKLADTLADFIWGITTELLGVTELFVSQSNDVGKKKELKNSIPVAKPVPCFNLIENLQDNTNSDNEPTTTNPHVEVLPLHQLTKLLLAALPKTRIKILTTPFAATWRQSISDTTSQ